MTEQTRAERRAALIAAGAITDDEATVTEDTFTYASATPNRWVPSPKVRGWIFNILIAAGPIVTFYGLMSAEEVALWLGLGGTILGTSSAALARANVPKSRN